MLIPYDKAHEAGFLTKVRDSILERLIDSMREDQGGDSAGRRLREEGAQK